MDRTILAVFSQRQAADQAEQALLHHGFASAQVQRFAGKDFLAGSASEEMLTRLRYFLGGNLEREAKIPESVEKYMDDLRSGSILIAVKAGPGLVQHAMRLLYEQNADQVQELTWGSGQADWQGLLPPDDERAFERPNREAEMESIGARYSQAPMVGGMERRTGQDRRQSVGRRPEDRSAARIH